MHSWHMKWLLPETRLMAAPMSAKLTNEALMGCMARQGRWPAPCTPRRQRRECGRRASVAPRSLLGLLGLPARGAGGALVEEDAQGRALVAHMQHRGLPPQQVPVSRCGACPRQLVPLPAAAAAAGQALQPDC